VIILLVNRITLINWIEGLILKSDVEINTYDELFLALKDGRIIVNK